MSPAADWSGFLRLWLALAVGLCLATAAWLAWSDPWWLWRRDPPWAAAARGNPNLDLVQRFTKPLALAACEADTVLIGSSRLYLGIDPRDVTLPPGARTYNFGVSSLSLSEIGMAITLAHRAGAQRLVIGLDDYMFDRVGTPPPAAIDEAMAEPGWNGRARLRALLSLDALRASRALWSGRTPEPGAWRPDGFKAIGPRPAEATRRLYAGERFSDRPVLPERLKTLDAVLDRLRAGGLPALLYLSPISAPMRSRLAEDGRWDDYRALRAAIAERAANHGFTFLDLATDHPFAAYDPERGSSDEWFDHHHFTPRVGRWILWRLGLRPLAD